jgi:hypothetical protein
MSGEGRRSPVRRAVGATGVTLLGLLSASVTYVLLVVIGR